MSEWHNGPSNTVASRMSGSSPSAATLTCFADCVCCRLTSARLPPFTQMASCAALISSTPDAGQSSWRSALRPSAPQIFIGLWAPAQSRHVSTFPRVPQAAPSRVCCSATACRGHVTREVQGNNGRLPHVSHTKRTTAKRRQSVGRNNKQRLTQFLRVKHLNL